MPCAGWCRCSSRPRRPKRSPKRKTIRPSSSADVVEAQVDLHSKIRTRAPAPCTSAAMAQPSGVVMSAAERLLIPRSDRPRKRGYLFTNRSTKENLMIIRIARHVEHPHPRGKCRKNHLMRQALINTASNIHTTKPKPTHRIHVASARDVNGRSPPR
jgi:hypothetical protein